jgi:DNA polymerase epsilon subunit 2
MLDGCATSAFVPKLLILCGSFTRAALASGSARDLQRYQGARAQLLPTRSRC